MRSIFGPCIKTLYLKLCIKNLKILISKVSCYPDRGNNSISIGQYPVKKVVSLKKSAVFSSMGFAALGYTTAQMVFRSK